MYTQDEMVAMLVAGECLVKFTKKDGEVRTIRGSLPPGSTAHNAKNVPIVESDTGLFKSFGVDSVIEFSTL
jgi:hypothetical protein